MKRNQTSMDVYDPSFTEVMNIPRDAIVHLPPSNLNISRLVLCRNFIDNNHCPKGHSCKFVHADITGKAVTRIPIHVNYAWRNAEQCEYKRLSVGQTLKVFAPNNRAPAELIPSERILATRGALAALEDGSALSHCAHYHFNRICNRGSKCSFVHAVYVDPTAQNLQKAPAPSMSTHQFPLADEEEDKEEKSQTSESEGASESSAERSTPTENADEIPADTVIVYQYRNDPYSFYRCHVVTIGESA